MRRGLQQDIGRKIVDRAREEIQQGERRETIVAAGVGGEIATAGMLPIHDPDGVLYFMCGVSECGGSDVCGP